MGAHPVTVVVQYQAQPNQADRAQRELTALVAEVVGEHACLGIELHQHADDPTRFLLYERWGDRETYLGEHMRTPHLQAFIQRARDFLAAPPEITIWRGLGTFDGVARAAGSPRPSV
jgi:quinol monooxygenase YgiN